jgi:pimeloyl-ACP methyl ester carboxylesterase
MEIAINVSENFVAVDDGSVYIRQWTPNSVEASGRYPIVLLHDSIGCVDMWRQFPLALARTLQRPVVAYDRLGYGRSSERIDLPSIRFISEEAEFYFPQIKEHLGIGKFAVFGHSVGGGMAVVIAANFPNACQAVITESAQAFVEQRTLRSIAAGKQQFAIPQQLEKLERFHGEKAAWVVRAWTDVWLSPEFADWNLRSDLPNVKSPLLAIHGDCDEYGSDAFPNLLSSLTSGFAEKMLIKGCGHVPHREQESLVLTKLREFLRETTVLRRQLICAK